jgi:hypothetical protein
MGNKLTQEEFVTKVIAKYGNKYGLDKVVYLTSKIDISVKCNKHGEYFTTTPNNLLNSGGCKKCACENIVNSVKARLQQRQDSFINKCKIIFNNLYDYSLVIYKDCYSELKIICPIHGVFEKVARAHIKGQGCQKCSFATKNGPRLTAKEVDDYLADNNKKIKRIGPYKKGAEPMDVQCLVCNNIWPAIFQNIKSNDSGCPNCTGYKQERFIRLFLEDNNIKTEKFRIKLPINKKYSHVDFYLSDFNLIIEYNGRQHYMPVCFGSEGVERAEDYFKYQVIRDQQLREYCAENNINLLEIDGRDYKGDKLIKYLVDYFKQNNIIAA